MNFLAHLYLSNDRPDIMIGNFIGDFVKGRNLNERFPPGIAKGIEMHRAIDLFTDSHPQVAQSKSRLRPKYRHYSGVIVDVFYDHFLARNWQQYHAQPLSDYAHRAYKLVQDHHPILPDDVKGMMPYMIRGNWLVGYASVDGIHQALSGMSRRTPYESKMNEARFDLETHYKEFEEEFRNFFEEARTWANGWLEENIKD